MTRRFLGAIVPNEHPGPGAEGRHNVPHGIRSPLRWATLAATLIATGALLAACGSSPSTSSSGTTTTTSNSSSQSVASQIDKLTSDSQSASNLTYQATYTYTSGGKSSTVTIAQSAPKYYLKFGTSEFTLYTGKTIYGCTGSVCVKYTTQTPLAASTLGIFNGKLFQQTVKEDALVQSVLAARGITVSFSSKTVANLPSDCVTASKSGRAWTWCVATSNGVLTSWSSNHGSFTLTSFTTSPPGSDFALPAGVRIVSIP